MFEIECEKIIYGKNKHTAFCEKQKYRLKQTDDYLALTTKTFLATITESDNVASICVLRVPLTFR